MKKCFSHASLTNSDRLWVSWWRLIDEGKVTIPDGTAKIIMREASVLMPGPVSTPVENCAVSAG
jgi:hypothetical protein